MLMTGAMLTQAREMGSGSLGSLLGFFCTILEGVLSAIAGVYSELLLKQERNIHVANVQLYAFGVLMNFGALVMLEAKPWHAGIALVSTWVVVVNAAVKGLAVSQIVKRFDNVVKIWCVSASNAVVYTVSILFLREKFSPVYVLGAALALSSLHVYNAPELAPTLPLKLRPSRGPPERREGYGGAVGELVQNV